MFPDIMKMNPDTDLNEIIDILIALLVLTLAFANAQGVLFKPNLFYIGLIFVALLTGFVLHELMHREVARKLGYRAYFKAWYEGLLLAFLFSFLGFVIAAPGATMIEDIVYDPRDEVKIAEAGPLTNIFFSILFLILSLIYSPLIIVSYVNIVLAVFNLLPINVGIITFDGYRLFKNDLKLWLGLFIPSVIIFLFLII